MYPHFRSRSDGYAKFPSRSRRKTRVDFGYPPIFREHTHENLNQRFGKFDPSIS